MTFITATVLTHHHFSIILKCKISFVYVYNLGSTKSQELIGVQVLVSFQRPGKASPRLWVNRPVNRAWNVFAQGACTVWEMKFYEKWRSLNSLFCQDKKGKKDKTTLSRLKRTFSNRGQKLMEKIGGGKLQRSTSRENLVAQSKLQQSERISRSTPMLAQIIPPEKVLECT